MKFKLHAPYQPAGDQPEAIEKLSRGITKNFAKQTLLGVTGSGKTFTIANVIDKVQRPTLVIAHNKTLAAQLCNEFREFFPKNAVEYFVSYYDYYQPEAYLAGSDTYIEKEAQINDEIDRLRHACTQALISRKDVIIVSSVSAIYNLGSPKEYAATVLRFQKDQPLDRRALLEKLIELQYERTNGELSRGHFRLHGQFFEITPVHEDRIYRFAISTKIDHIEILDPLTRRVLSPEVENVWLFPAKHYVLSEQSRREAVEAIRHELKERLAFYKKNAKPLEYERLSRRVRYDLELIQNIGFCGGIENYSRYFENRPAGEPPFTLLDYFKHNSPDFLTVIDESHVTVPQIRGMYAGDLSRKNSLIEHGFRLPSARDNRPLTYAEFDARAPQTIYVSATPAEYELTHSEQIVEQIVRPTGLIDPEIIIRPVTEKDGQPSQIADVITRVKEKILKNERTLITTLTKKTAEDLTEFLQKKQIKVTYLHSDVETLARIETIMRLRQGEIDVLVGVNLLREGLDIPEVGLVAILDADKEGFLRSETSLIQTIGRAARNAHGQVILYADEITGSMSRAIAETDRRRTKQIAYNEKHGITPQTIKKSIRNILAEFGITPGGSANRKIKNQTGQNRAAAILELDLKGDARPLEAIIKDKEKQMRAAAKNLEFELAAILRDEILHLKKRPRAK